MLNPEPADLHKSVRSLLLKYGLRAKKSWGQNFLVDDRAYQAIVRAAKAGPDDLVLEIGAGLGTLTDRLLGTGARVVAVEREREMCRVLREELSGRPGFELREENALTLDVEKIAREHGGKIVLVGNLPYQIAAPLLFHFMEARGHLRRVVVMLQREVAQRLLAPPGTEHYGALTAQIGMLAQVHKICHVGPRGFWPPPKVESTVVVLEPFERSFVEVRDLGIYSKVVRAAFGQRRKTLRNALGSVFGEAAERALRTAGIEPGRRGETLSIQEFARLSDSLLDAQAQGLR